MHTTGYNIGAYVFYSGIEYARNNPAGSVLTSNKDANHLWYCLACGWHLCSCSALFAAACVCSRQMQLHKTDGLSRSDEIVLIIVFCSRITFYILQTFLNIWYFTLFINDVSSSVDDSVLWFYSSFHRWADWANRSLLLRCRSVFFIRRAGAPRSVSFLLLYHSAWGCRSSFKLLPHSIKSHTSYGWWGVRWCLSRFWTLSK